MRLQARMKKAVIIIFLVAILLIVVSGKKYVEETVNFLYPINGRITGKYGEKRSTGVHNGIDLAAPNGTEIKAPERGLVSRVWSDTVNGNAITIIHFKGYSTGYAHLSKQLVKVGDTVKQGQTIGLVGSTGRSTGNHLHWVVKKYNVTIDPLTVLKS